jgi:hypothetical protein
VFLLVGLDQRYQYLQFGHPLRCSAWRPRAFQSLSGLSGGPVRF